MLQLISPKKSMPIKEMETRRNNLAMILRKSHLYLTHGKMGKLRSKSWGIPFFPNTTITKQFFTLQYEKNPAKSTPIKPKNHYPKIISFPPSYSLQSMSFHTQKRPGIKSKI